MTSISTINWCKTHFFLAHNQAQIIQISILLLVSICMKLPKKELLKIKVKFLRMNTLILQVKVHGLRLNLRLSSPWYKPAFSPEIAIIRTRVILSLDKVMMWSVFLFSLTNDSKGLVSLVLYCGSTSGSGCFLIKIAQHLCLWNLCRVPFKAKMSVTTTKIMPIGFTNNLV